jgi:tRNA modification GTPase
MSQTDTIFALSSGRPPAAVSIIRISGSLAHEAGSRVAGTLPEARLAAIRAIRHPHSRDLLDEALVLRFDGPASSTGEDVVELHCHGGRAVVDAVLAALQALEGLRPAVPGEFTRRAFESGRIDLTEAEGLADLIEAETQSQRKAALALAEGGLKKQIGEWQGKLLALSAAAERAIDYDEDDAELDPSLARGCGDLAGDLELWLEMPRAETLKDGVRVVIAGPPNVGKSSLINAVAGFDRAIVTDVPGTTRDHIDVPVSLGGIPLVFTDTAGLRDTSNEVEAIGVARSESLAERADVLVWMGDPDSVPTHPRAVVVHSKVDLAGRENEPDGSLPLSTLTGVGLAALLKTICVLANEILPTEGAIALNRRQAAHIVAAELALRGARSATDVVLVAEHLRTARNAFDRLTGSAGVEDVLDALFSRFCLGK